MESTIEKIVEKIEEKLPTMWCYSIESWRREGSLFTLAKISHIDGIVIKTQICDSPYFAYKFILAYLIEPKTFQ